LFTFLKTRLREKINKDENYDYVKTSGNPAEFDKAAQITTIVWRDLVRQIRQDGAVPVFLLATEPEPKIPGHRSAYTVARSVSGEERVALISPSAPMKRYFADDPEKP
jgi:hypothetical protein